MAAGADCAETLSDETKSLTLDEFLGFLEPAPPRGAALCMSAEDFTRLKTALEQACQKLGTACKAEAKAQIRDVAFRVSRLQERVAAKRKIKSEH